jgi:microcystin-dependent protein
MAKIDLSYDIENYTPADAGPVDVNFDRVEQHINQELIERDGTVAMRAQLKLVGDPVAPLDAAPKQYVDQVLPIGIIMMHGGTTEPPGGRWALCNGAELQTASYPDLFNTIGHNFSPAGTPGSRFNLPNLRDRVPMGVGTDTTMGETGGYRAASLPTHSHNLNSHTHTINHNHGPTNTSTAGSHDHVTNFNVQTNTGTGTLQRLAGAGSTEVNTVMPAGNHSHSVDLGTFSGSSGGPSNNSTSTAGIDPTDRNLPPFLGVQYVIRVK